jgi:tetratricopeptide (TPR) repeat protein
MNINAFQTALDEFISGNLNQAENICRKILRSHPDNADVLHLIGIIFFEQGNYEMAITHIKKSIRLNKENADAYYNLGNAYVGKGLFDEALPCYLETIRLNPGIADAYINIGNIHREKKQTDKAMAYYKEAVKTDPSLPDASNNLGNILIEKGRLDEAIECFQMVTHKHPGFAPAFFNLGRAFQIKSQFDDAVLNYREAVKLNPSDAETYNNLGTALYEKGEIAEAVKCYRKAMELKEDLDTAHCNLGITLHQQGYFDEALLSYRKALLINPELADAHLNMSYILLSRCNFKDGWKEFEWRWKTGEFISQQRALPKPAWDGSDIAGKTILLTSEQGFGDVIQFVRYAPLLAGRGAKVIVECLKEMNSLLQTVEGIHQIIVKGKTLPDFDIHCPLLSLPYLFNTTPETIPANIPYLHAGNDLLQIWREKFQPNNDKHRIGIAWAGNPRHSNDRNRSCQPEIFLPLTENKAVSLFSLQKDSYTVQSDNVIKKMGMIDYTNEINDFSDTAAFIMNLDLVISVDTAVAHLAGALGKPVWLLLPFVPDWRWMLDREDSPWYPTMKLFRQPQPCDWGSIIHLITENINNILR